MFPSHDQGANTGTVTYTNRWGIYQEGTSDLNYIASNLLIGSTTNNGNRLQVTGSANITSGLTFNTGTATTSLIVGGLRQFILFLIQQVVQQRLD